MYYVTVYILFHVTAASALLGYDCGGTAANITTVSLLGTGECDIPTTTPNRTDVYVQLLQLTDYDSTVVYQCRVEIDRTIYYCGMHSHVSAVKNGRRVYLMDLSTETCKSAINTGSLSLNSFTHLTELSVNATNFRSVTLSGTLSTDGKCAGTQYADAYGTWDNVVVQGTVRVNLRTYNGIIKLKDDIISLRGHIQCPFSKGRCLTDENGSASWTIVPESTCDFKQYTSLYEGMATKITPSPTTPHKSIMYTVTKGDKVFALMRKSEHHLCGYTLVQTEHPKLFIVETQRGRTTNSRTKLLAEDVDLLTYINTKFVYVEKHNQEQLENLYNDVLQQRCAIEQQVLKNALALASILPDMFAYAIMKSPGYIAVIGGEVAHIVKCVPVPVKIRHTERCYQELPVTYQNQSTFLRPKTRTLVKQGTIIELCNALLPQQYLIEGIWYQLLPKPSYVREPQALQPNQETRWKYVDAGSLATNGIYSQSDLENMRDHIMFPIEQPSILNTIARGATGQDVPIDKLDLMNVLSEQSFETFAESVTSKLWNSLLKFGSVSAAILGIIFIIRIIKLVIDSIVRGYALHTIYGWSLQLLGAVWGSITSLLLHLGKQRDQHDARKSDEASELREVTTLVNASAETSEGGKEQNINQSKRVRFKFPTMSSSIPESRNSRDPSE